VPFGAHFRQPACAWQGLHAASLTEASTSPGWRGPGVAGGGDLLFPNRRFGLRGDTWDLTFLKHGEYTYFWPLHASGPDAGAMMTGTSSVA